MYLPEETEYCELDIDGQPDFMVDLEGDLPLIMDDGAFETVICTDVLEHLDNLHEVFDELCRVASDTLIISLPNALNEALSAYLKPRKGKHNYQTYLTRGRFMKYYGIPPEKPSDRHKWFFSATEAIDFFTFHETLKDYWKVEEVAYLGYVGSSIKGKIARYLIQRLLGENVMIDMFVGSVWVVLRRSPDKSIFPST